MAIHHKTAARAIRLGVTIIESEDGIFRAIRKEDEAKSKWVESAPKLLDAVEKGEADFEEPEAAEETETPPKSGRSGVIGRAYYDRYIRNGGGCGDVLDQSLRDYLMTEDGIDMERLRAVADDNGVWTEKWARLNHGMQRMNLANRLRSILRNDAEAAISLGGERGRYGVEYAPSKRSGRMIRHAATV